MINAVQNFCGRMKGPERYNETWWWNEKVSAPVNKKWLDLRTRESWSKQPVKKVVSLAKEHKSFTV